MPTASEWIKTLALEPHPEGGFFRETYRSDEMNQYESFEAVRNVSTGIYFMLTQGNFSAFHRIKSDEMWHFYDGSSITIFCIDESGRLIENYLGLDIANNQQPQILIPANCWFASRLSGPGKFALAGCTVAPGFDFQDFELGDRVELIRKYPQHESLIRELTR